MNASGHSTGEREGVSAREMRRMRADVLTGMIVSHLVMYLIMLTSAATLHAHGKTAITTARDAAEALRPLAGDGAYLLFSLGLIGAGMLGVPVLAGACAYAISEASGWVGSMGLEPRLAHGFYTVIALAMALGLGLDFAGLDAVKMLFWAAVVNGTLASPLLILVVLVTSRADVMGEHRNGRLLRWLGWSCAGVMLAATVIMFATAFRS
jgi:Mn2+/Fe2+ NRAMP family transporter